MFLELRAAHSAHLHISYQTPCLIEQPRAQECFTRLKSLDVVSERLHQPACCQANIFVVIYDRYEGSRLHGHLPCRGFTSQALGRNSIEIMLPQLIK